MNSFIPLIIFIILFILSGLLVYFDPKGVDDFVNCYDPFDPDLWRKKK